MVVYENDSIIIDGGNGNLLVHNCDIGGIDD